MSAFNFEQCLKCTICTFYCPMMAVNPEYPGPKQAGPDGERFRIKDPASYDEALRYCLNCKRCEVSCPSGVRIGDIIQSAKLKYGSRDHTLRGFALGNTDLVGTVAGTFAPIANPVLKWKVTGKLMDSLLGVDSRRVFPEYASESFEQWYRREVEGSQSIYPRQVSYFHGCAVNYNYPQLGAELVSLCNALGVGVHLLDREKCCGVALISNGFEGKAKANAAINLSSIRKAAGAGRKIITTSTTCTFTIRDEYPHLLGIPNSDVRDSIETATRYIFSLADSGGVRFAWKPGYRAKIAYHTPCHMEKLGWDVYSIRLLSMIPGVELTVLPKLCCGIAGTFGFKKENYEFSQAIGRELFDGIAQVRPDFVATDCETCKWQIEMSTPFSVKHPISVLFEALDIEKTKRMNR